MDRIDKDSNDDIEKFRLNFSNRLTVTSLFFKFVVSSVYLVSNSNFGHWKIYHFN